jgi:choline monooxygenase
MRWLAGDLREEIDRFEPGLPIERAHTPPASWYVDPRFFELERRAVFGRTWQAVARLDEVAAPGAYVAGCVAGLPWVVVRGDDGGLRAFHNACRHKGREVVTGRGTSSGTLVCGYHAWQYTLDGRLKSAPRMAGVEDFDRAAMSLEPMGVEAFGQTVFVHADPGAAPLAPGIEELARRLGARRGGHRFLARAEFEIRANWKTVVDNYLDGGYHVPHMHPSLDAQIDMASYRTEVFERSSIQSAGPGGAAERIGEGAIYAWVYPNFMLNLYGPCIDTNTVVPLAPDRCKVVYDFYFIDDGRGDAERFTRASMEQSAVTQREDTEICESVQIGLGSPSYDRGRYAPRVEMGEHHFHRLLHADYTAAL